MSFGGGDKVPREQLVSAQQDAQVAKATASDALNAARKQVQAEMASTKAQLDEQSQRLDARKAELDQREGKIAGLEAAAKANQFKGDGTYIVGTDIQPGTYKADASPRCYWERLRNLDGGVGSIIDNDNTTGPVVLAVQPSDKAVRVSGCAPFRKVG